MFEYLFPLSVSYFILKKTSNVHFVFCFYSLKFPIEIIIYVNFRHIYAVEVSEISVGYLFVLCLSECVRGCTNKYEKNEKDR